MAMDGWKNIFNNISDKAHSIMKSPMITEALKTLLSVAGPMLRSGATSLTTATAGPVAGKIVSGLIEQLETAAHN